MGEFRVRKLLSEWTVQNGHFILSQEESVHRAIAFAVESAAKAADKHPSRVVYERSEAEREVIWDSSRDGYSKA
jgi:hypothetical protein